MRIHSAVGPGLLESVYEACIEHELLAESVGVERQVAIPVRYKGVVIQAGYRLDLLIGGNVVVEVKAVEKLMPIHHAQVLSYLRLGGYKLGLLLNFNTVHMRDGIKRVVNAL
jgi:GxxExxY protein